MTDTPLDDAISRLTAWIRDFGSQKQPQFIDDLTAVLDAARSFRSAITAPASVCTCHERDGSFVCPYCYSLGRRGHMQRLDLAENHSAEFRRRFNIFEFTEPDNITQIPPDLV